MNKNQKFVLFGPAPHVLEGYFNFPSEYHICRVGNVFPLTQKMKWATGSHTDYWYPANQLLAARPEICFHSGIRYIRITKLGAKYIPKEVMHKWSRTSWQIEKLQKELGCMPNRGLRAMIDILAQDPQELHIIGFTFYQGEPYYPGYTTPEHYEYTKKNQGNLSNHRQDPQIKYFKKKILTHPAVRVDAVMEEMFNLK